MPPNNLYHDQSGNIFLIILLGVALFAALSFSVSRGLQSTNTSTLSDREIKLAVSDLLSYAQRVSQGVDRVRRNGCSENDISFYMPGIPELTGYEHATEVEDRCKVFHPDGGGATYRAPMEGVNNGGPWYFLSNRVGNFGNSVNTGTAAEDLTLILRGVDIKVCDQINAETNGFDIWESGGNHNAFGPSPPNLIRFTGSYDAGFAGINRGSNNPPETGCFCDGSSPCNNNIRHFYSVLLTR